jgi:hypothetical protein
MKNAKKLLATLFLFFANLSTPNSKLKEIPIIG